MHRVVAFGHNSTMVVTLWPHTGFTLPLSETRLRKSRECTGVCGCGCGVEQRHHVIEEGLHGSVGQLSY